MTRALAASLFLLAGCADASSPSLEIVSPADDQTVEDTDALTPGVQFQVRCTLAGYGSRESMFLGGPIIRLVDTDPGGVENEHTVPSDGMPEITIALTLPDGPGTRRHLLQAFDDETGARSSVVTIFVGG